MYMIFPSGLNTRKVRGIILLKFSKFYHILFLLMGLLNESIFLLPYSVVLAI